MLSIAGEPNCSNILYREVWLKRSLQTGVAPAACRPKPYDGFLYHNNNLWQLSDQAWL